MVPVKMVQIVPLCACKVRETVISRAYFHSLPKITPLGKRQLRPWFELACAPSE